MTKSVPNGHYRPTPAQAPEREIDRGDHLATLEKKLQLIRDRVAAVADGTATGFYL